MRGRVKRSTGSWYEVMPEGGLAGGIVLKARAKGKLRLQERKTTNPIAVGDWVTLEETEHGEWNISHIEDRRNYIIRRASNASRQWHIIASNLDGVVVVASLRLPRTSQGFIDRALVTAEAYEIPGYVLFNKRDLYGEAELEHFEMLRELYEAIGYRVFSSSLLSEGLTDEVSALFDHKTQLVIGHSGVGKTTLLNLISPGLNLKTAEVSAFSEKGKHTTTFAEMHPAANGGWVIDTPGIKEFGLVEIEKVELGHYFPEMRPYFDKCKFGDCLHLDEPGCAVQAAYDEGKIHPLRYNSYLSMLHEEDDRR